MKEKKVKQVPKYQWVLGFLGFLGIMGYSLDISFYVFFAFFGFFSWYWEYKLQQGVEDERLIENRLRARDIAFRTSFGIVWLGAVFSGNILLRIFPIFLDYKNRYAFLLVLVAVGFAIGSILKSYLAYRYDTKE